MAKEREAIDHLRGATPLTDLDTSEMVAIVESAPDGMVLVSSDGLMLAVNRRVESMFGYDRGELLGRPVELLVPESGRERHREHRVAYAEQPVIREMGSGMELVGRRSDGTEFPIEVALGPLDQHVRAAAVIASVRDVSETRVLRDRIESEQRRFSSIFHEAPVAITLTRLTADGARTIELANQAFADLLDRPLDEIIGADFAELTAPADRASGVAAASEMIAAERDRFVTEKRYVRGDGSHIWVLLHSSVISRDPDVVTLAHIVDITDRRARQAQRERLDLMEDRERIARGLHDLVIQRLFAAGMGLQAVATTQLPAEVADSLHRTIDELDSTIREIRSTIFDLHADVRPSDSGRTLLDQIDAERARISVASSVSVAGDLGAVPHATLTEAVPAIREMLSNVARHARADHVEIRVTAGSGRLEIVVDDDGTGFELGSDRGNGLDNLFARARALGGECTIDSAPSRGTLVRWDVPI